MITQKSVKEILETARIEDIVGDFVTLKRRGANYQGLCPFHNEKTPSFSVNPARNIFKCFGCGKGGDPVTFLIEHERISYPEALRYIAKRYNIDVEETEVSKEYIEEKQLSDALYIVNERALKFFQSQLMETDAGRSIGLNYFKQRGFRTETIEKWGLGFTPDSRDALTKTLLGEQYALDYMRRLGLTSKQYEQDFFRNRVMFTIHSLTGKPIAFAGRTMQKDVQPKYINSPETEIYNKSKTLYGLFFARKAIQTLDECILVEGYTDVISLHQAGIENVVASSGTSLTVEQIRAIKRFTPNIKILYDGDAAGVKAALRGLDLVLEEDMNVKIVLLPDKEDPDSYMQRVGASAFQTFIQEQAKDFILFKAENLMSEAKEDPIKKAKVVRDIVGSIAKIPESIKRGLYIRECAALMQVDEAILVGETAKIVRKNLEERRKGSPASAQQTEAGIVPDEMAQPADNQAYTEGGGLSSGINLEFQEGDIARILVVHGARVLDTQNQITVAQYIISNIEELLNSFENRIYRRIVQDATEMLRQGQVADLSYFNRHTMKEVRDFAATVASSPYGYSAHWEGRLERPLETQKLPEDNYELDAVQAIKRFKLRQLIKMCQQNQATIKQTATEGDMEKLMRHMKVQQKLIEMRNALATELGTVVF